MFVSTGSTNGCRDPYPELVEGYPELVEGDGCLFMTYRIEAETILDIGEVILKVLLIYKNQALKQLLHLEFLWQILNGFQ